MTHIRYFLCFLILRSRESLTDILSHEAIGPISKSLHFQFVKFILIGHFFHVLLTNEHSLTKNQNDCFTFCI